jgi:molecular chaperone HscB
VATPSPSAEASLPSAPGEQRNGDAFDVLRLEPLFDLDLQALAERHRALSLTLHPDRFAGRPAAERRLSLERSMQVNSAYRALRDPIERARVLAERMGLSLTAESAHDPEFLERTMEQREALSEAVLAGDKARIGEFARLAQDEERALLSRLSALFAAPVEPGRTVTSLMDLLSRLRFARRLLQSCEAELEAP